MSKVVQPTHEQDVKIQARLRKKYPHMGREEWISKLKKNVRRRLRSTDPLKKGRGPAGRVVIDRMRQSLSDAEIKRLGKK